MLTCFRQRPQLSRALACQRSFITLRPDWSASDFFGDPPPTLCRRVVVTGLGLVTPLGVGVEKSWEKLLAGKTGVTGLTEHDLPEVCKVLTITKLTMQKNS